MKINIAPKLFSAFLLVICLNAFFVVVVSKFSSLNNIASILKRQNEIKNKLLQISSLHVVQSKSRLIFREIGLDESAESFRKTGSQITLMIDTVLSNIRTVVILDSIVSNNKTNDPELLALRKSFSEKVSENNKKYNERFEEFVVVKNGKDKDKIELLNASIDTADSSFRAGLRSTNNMIDSQNRARIKEIGQRIDNLRNLTQLILLGMSIFSISFALLFSRAISKSLRRLRESARTIAKGEFDFNPRGYPKDEIGDLAEAFFDMAYDLKKAQEELIKKRRLAAIGEIVASVNHEINNPLMIISGNAQFLEMTIENGVTADTKERIHAILEETERISQVTRKLRDIKNPVVEDYTSSGEQMINLDKSTD